MAKEKNTLPQGGTGCSAAGETSTETLSSVCPANLGGGAPDAIALNPTPRTEEIGEFCNVEAIDAQTTSSINREKEITTPITLGGTEARKRPLSMRKESESESASSSKAMAPPKVPKSRRGREGRSRRVRRSTNDRAIVANVQEGSNVGETDSDFSQLGSFDMDTRRTATEDSIDTEDELFNSSVPPVATKAKKNLPAVSELVKEMQAKSTCELSECVKKNLLAVEKVTDRSRNLKGSFVHSLRLAAITVEAAFQEIAKRVSIDENVARLERENGELRAQICIMDAKLNKFSEELHFLRTQNRSIATNVCSQSTQGKVSSVQRQTSASPMNVAPNIARSSSKERSSKKSGESGLMEQIGMLIEQKLAAFKAESTTRANNFYGKRTLNYIIPRLINEVPKTLKDKITINNIKYKIKDFFLSNY